MAQEVGLYISETNPYSTGRLVVFDDGTELLLREKLEYELSNGDSLHTLTEGDRLTLLAGRYYKDDRWWWVIADANNIMNPYDLEGLQDLVIPDLERVKNQIRQNQ